MKGFKVQGKELAAAFFQCFGFALLFLPFGTTASAQPVGEVLFAVGSASVQGSSGSSLQRGSFVSVGDVLETGSGSHVHIRFVDGALLSVRPNSRLAIDQYQFDAERPQASQVKFQLREGTARSITGKAGESAKERFRLNTPVAAVGVRGTDFVTATSALRTSVVVNTGAVVVAPLGQGCSADSLGPCEGVLARVLSAEMGRVLAQVEPGAVRFLPLRPGRIEQAPHPAEPASIAQGSSQRLEQVEPVSAAQIATPGVLTAGDVTIQINGLSAGAQANSAPVNALFAARTLFSEQRSQGSADAVGVAQTAKPATSLPLPLNPATSLPASTLEWGRWASAPIPGESDPAPIIERADYTRMLVSDGVNAIFGPSDARAVTPKEGQFQFVLRDARAALMTDAGPTAGRIQGGTLGIDFAEGSFQTSLRGSHEAVDGTIVLTAQGPLRSDGLFRAVSNDALDPQVVGVVANAGKEAVYVFSTPVKTRGGSSTSFFGLTRWGR